MVKDIGILKGYPKIKRKFGKLTGYIQILRPFTLVAPLLAGIFGVLTPVENISLKHVYTAVYVGLTLALAQGVGQVLNQYADIELDKVIKPHRPLPSGILSREEALGLSWLLAIFTFGRAFTINMFFGLTVLILMFFAVFYSLAPLSPRKINPVLNIFWMAVSRGFLPMLAVWNIYGNLAEALKYSLLSFIWVLGFQSTKDVPDVEGDKIFGIKTIPLQYGTKGLFATMITCTLLYSAITIFFRLYHMLLILPLAFLAIFTIKRQTALIENTYAWGCFYIGLGLIYVLMFMNALFF